MDHAEYQDAYRKLSNAQRRYILDRTYISYNPKTQEVLIREGYVIPYKERNRSYNESNCLVYGTKFTKKTHDMVKHYFDSSAKKQKIDFPDMTPVTSDEELLDVFSEIAITCPESDCHIYFHRAKHGFLSGDVNYIIHPHYRWKIEIDRTAGKFLRRESVSGSKGSYMYTYKN